MLERKIRIQQSWGSKDRKISDRANEENEGRSSSHSLSWYIAQRPMPGLKYVATSNGYAVLS